MILVYPNFYCVTQIDEKSREFQNLLYNFAIWNKVYHRYETHTFKYIDNNVHLPSTVPLGQIQKIFPFHQVEYHLDEYPAPRQISYNMKYGPRNEIQREMEAFLFDLTKKDTDQRYIGVPPGTGKTFSVVNMVSQLKLVPLIVVNTSSLADQWKREFLKHSDLKESDIYLLSGSDSVFREMGSKKKHKVYIAIHRTLGNLIAQDPVLLTEMHQKLGIGIRITDEFHLEFTNICAINNVSNVKYTVYLSATPDRSMFEESQLFGRIFKNVDYYNGSHLQHQKYHNIAIYPYNSLPSPAELQKVEGKFGFNRNIWAANVMNNSEDIFRETVVDIIKLLKLTQRQKRTAFIVPTLKMVDCIKDTIKTNFPMFDTKTFTGDTPDEDRAEALQADIIVTTEKIFATGMDVKNLEIVVNFTPIGSAIQIEQTVGRLRNLTANNRVSVFVDATDYGYNTCVRHLNQVRLPYYKRVAQKIIKVEK